MNRIAIPRKSEAEGFRLLPIEWATILYALFTTALLFLFWRHMHAPGFLLAERIAVLGGVAAFATFEGDTIAPYAVLPQPTCLLVSGHLRILPGLS